MSRFHPALLVTALALLLPPTASADEVEIAGGSFAFLHDPIDPNSGTICPDALGLQFSVDGDFSGFLATDAGSTLFGGAGSATGCAFAWPREDGSIAEFSGSFTWATSVGELQGDFLLLDFPTGIEGVFYAVAFISFDGGTGKFQGVTGDAFAQGFDLPFGGLGTEAGVLATITDGELNLPD